MSRFANVSHCASFKRPSAIDDVSASVSGG
jgi:hypothetical protein